MHRRISPLVSLAAVGALMLGGAAPAAAAPTTVSSVDFEDGTTGTWTRSGGTDDTLRVIDLDGGKVLEVAGRDADYVGIQSPTGIYEAGATYDFSLRVRLAPGTPDTSARLVMKPAYTWIGNTTVTASGWTTISGSYTAEAGDVSGLQAYIGTPDIAGTPAFTYYVDDILVTSEAAPGGGEAPDVAPGGAVNPTATPVSAAQGTGNVAALTFDDGPNPGTTPALLDFLAENDITAVFCVIGQNITAPGGADILRRIVAEGHVLCNHSTTYDDMGSLTQAQASARMAENLSLIRTALGDDDFPVPFFRAPNGSWGNTPAAAVSLGMQPLAVTNTINDWETQDVPTLTTNLRAATKAGQVVLVHDGGGDRSGSLAAVRTVVPERLADGWTFSLPVGAPAAQPGGGEGDPQPGDVLIESDFDSGDLDGWSARAGSDTSDPEITVVDGGADETVSAVQVGQRTHEGDGVQHDIAGLLEPGETYAVSAAVRFAPGSTTGQGLTLSARTVSGGTPNFSNLLQIENATATGWTTVRGEFTVPTYDSDAEIYFEARYNSGNTSTFLVDQVRISVPEAAQVDTDLTGLKETVDFPLGVAIDSRETTGAASQLLLHHYDQITPENHMKVEAWYTGPGQFARNPEATALLDYAQAEDLRLYGHVLVWHSQTPAWFFQDDAGRELTTSDADKEQLRERLRTHIFRVAASIADDYGLYGSDTNQLVAWDVVNEVISDQATPDGLRTSRWYQVLGEEFIRLAFRYADEAFNDEYAAPGTDRPVKLFINDYNTEIDAKGAQYEALVRRLLDADVPIDGVGHQFHTSINTPISALRGALERFEGLGLLQAVTELDVTINPADDPNRVRQGYFYRDVFALLREYQAAAPAAEKIFSATVWGLTDTRSWRAEQQPLPFTGGLQPKPAYYGAIDDSAGLPPLVTTANVFEGDVQPGAGFTDAPEWRNLPFHPLTADAGGWQARWNDDHLAVIVRSAATPDRVAFTYGGQEYFFAPGVSGSVAGAQEVVDGVTFTLAHLPHSGVEAGQGADFDVRLLRGGEVVGGWNSPGATGRLSFLEPLSFLQVPELAAPTVDGQVDAAYADAAVATTGRTVEGSDEGASAEVRTL